MESEVLCHVVRLMEGKEKNKTKHKNNKRVQHSNISVADYE